MTDCTCVKGGRCLTCIERDGLTKAPVPTCSEHGCTEPGSNPVDTNYGHLGDLCDVHYARLERELAMGAA